jgi:hypothetical protein
VCENRTLQYEETKNLPLSTDALLDREILLLMAFLLDFKVVRVEPDEIGTSEEVEEENERADGEHEECDVRPLRMGGMAGKGES